LNTAEALEAITDRGRFELLVTSVLRRDNKDYAAIIHTGINAQGEPIKSPLDGFCRVPRSEPPLFILAQHTTTDKKKLEKKWVYEHTVTKRTKSANSNLDGDLVKAAYEAQEIRKEFTNAKFIVVLATNQCVSQYLARKVYKKASKYKLEVDIWEQSRIVDFLDNKAEGQWLRKKYLGIEAEMLSKDLLRNLCEKSISFYKKEVSLTNYDNWVPRKIDNLIQKCVCTNTYTIHFFVGESGFGKSIAAYRLLQKYFKSFQYGLWIPADLIQECISLTDVLNKILKKLHPYLQPDAGKELVHLINEGKRFLLVVDDLNRTNEPIKLAYKLLSWLKPEQSNASDEQLQSVPYIVLCPIWPHNWAYLRKDISKKSWIDTVFIGRMTTEEAAQVVQSATTYVGREISKAEAREIATKMANDPFIIGSFSSVLAKAKFHNLNLLAEEAIEQFIKSCNEEVASRSDVSYLSSEYYNVLSTLIFLMLRNRKLHPTWTEIQNWLKNSPTELAQLRELVKNSKLCRLTDQGKFVFRHDRIQETLMVDNITRVLDNSTLDSEILREPFYATIIGQALMRSPQNQEFLKEIRIHNPLALFEAIRYFSSTIDDYHKMIIKEVKKWGKRNVIDGVTISSVFEAACWSLVNTDSPSVVEITKDWPLGPLTLLARLRNGLAKSGALFCSLGLDYAFMMKDNLRDQIIGHAKRYHEEQLLEGVKQLLQSSAISDRLRVGTLILVGFLNFTNLQEDILKCWELATDKLNVLPAAIWAVVRCYSEESSKSLDLLMKYWADLPDKENSDKTPSKRDIAEVLHHGLAHGIQDKVVKYFISQYDIHKSLRRLIIHICERIDSPEAIEFVVRRAAEIEKNISGTDKISFWLILLSDRWDPSRPSGRRLSNASMVRLKTLWGDPQSDKFVRRRAFRIWLKNINNEQLNTLKSIPSNSPLFYDALQKRTKLGDYSCVPDLIPVLENKSHWFSVAQHVWCYDVMAAAQKHLQDFKNNIPADFSGGRSNTHYDLSNMLMMIPVKDSENLLETYWEHLGYSTLFIQTALYVGTPKCLELAANSISRCPKDILVFNGIGIHFGFLDSERQKYLTKRHLDSLLPYLDRIRRDDLWQLAQVCQQLGIPEWGLEHLSDRLNETHRKHFYPSDNDLLNELSEFLSEKHGMFRVKHWLERFQERYYPKEQIIHIVEHWLSLYPTLERLKIAAICIQIIGNRKDLAILDKYKIDGQAEEITNIKMSVRFSVYRRSLD